MAEIFSPAAFDIQTWTANHLSLGHKLHSKADREAQLLAGLHMMEYKLYSDQLTATEAELGFQRVIISDPDNQYMGHGSMIVGVVFSLGPNNRIIKMNKPTPMTGASYVHQTFGVYGSRDLDPEWKPVFVGFDDAETAIRAAKAGRRDVQVNPTASVIEMRCPNCREEFEVQADFLPLGGKIVCPSCKHTDKTETFDAVNI